MQRHIRFTHQKACILAAVGILLIVAIPPLLPPSLALIRHGLHLLPKRHDLATANMGFVPPHVIKAMTKSPHLSDEQRKAAQETLQKDEERAEQRRQQSLLARVPVRVLQRFAEADPESLKCSDELRKEAKELVELNKSRWPNTPEVGVSADLKGVLDAHPGLWEDETETEAEAEGAGEDESADAKK